jgi:multidrug resistance protein MdtO
LSTPLLAQSDIRLPAWKVSLDTSSAGWFLRFFKQELSNYPGRLTTVAHLLVGSTVVMLLIMYWQIPGGALAAYYCANLTRNSLELSRDSALKTILAFVCGGAYVMLGTILMVNYPFTHFLYVVGSLFLCFYIVKVVADRVAAAQFAVIIILCFRGWVTNAPIETLVESNLWTIALVALGRAVSIAVEYAFELARPEQRLQDDLMQRIKVVIDYLRGAAKGGPDSWVRLKLQQFAISGVRDLRPVERRESFERVHIAAEQIGAIGDLVESVALLAPGEVSSTQLAAWADEAAEIPACLKKRDHRCEAMRRGDHPIADAIFRSLTSKPRSSRGLQPTYIVTSPASKRFFVPDAFQNADNIKYALRGCLAASLAYIVWNALSWPGLYASLFTCFVIALWNPEQEKQKQVLRIAGACIGGFGFGVGGQALILPMLHGIGAFTLFFVIVISLCAWVMASSVRLSYLGYQAMLAFFLVHLNEPYAQTDLTIGRDRVIGVMLGLLCMWFAFDTFGTVSVAKKLCILLKKTIREVDSYAKIMRDPVTAKHEVETEKAQGKLAQLFLSLVTQGDAIPFDVGPKRKRDVALRRQILQWLPDLRQIAIILIHRSNIGRPFGADALAQLSCELTSLEQEIDCDSLKNSFGERTQRSERQPIDHIERIFDLLELRGPTAPSLGNT